MLAAAEVAAAAVVRYKYLCEGSCFGACSITRPSEHLACLQPHLLPTAPECSVLHNPTAAESLNRIHQIAPCFSAHLHNADSMLHACAAGQQVSRLQVVRGITFVYLPPPRRKVPYAAAIASAPLPRCAQVMKNDTIIGQLPCVLDW